jgi:enoyl-CoA hydratase/carnithine racemase
MATVKRQLAHDQEAGFADAVRDADALMLTALEQPDFREFVSSHVERRSPSFASLAP